MIARSLALAALLMLTLAAASGAQAPAYAAQPPTPGALYGDGQTGRYLLGGSWLFRADPQDVGLSRAWSAADPSTAGWSSVTVPNAYNGDFSSPSMAGYVAWYRRDFVLPPGAFARYVPTTGRRWIIRFESVNYAATVWLNGRQIGTHRGAYLPFELDLTGLHAGVNRLTVRVDNRRTPADLPPGPGGGWWNFGGIVREVYLRRVQQADLRQFAVRPVLGCTGCAATIEERAVVRNLTSAPLRVRLRGRYGPVPLDFGEATLAPHSSWHSSSRATLDHPRLWSIRHPHLYRAVATLYDDRGRGLGGFHTDSGIRTIALTPGGMLTLNGQPLHLRGVNVHEQDLSLGSALDSAHLARLVGWARTLGSTVIRAHYPLNPQIEEMADRDGVLLWSEIPAYQVRSQYLDDPGWLAQAHAMLAQNIATNQNHPSVLLWSIGNELPTPVDPAEAAYIAGASALAHRLDPTRPVAMAVSAWPGVPCQRAYAPLDAVGFNDYFGWFDAGGGTTDDRDSLGAFLERFRACYRAKALFVTEFGFEGNRHGPVEERGTYEFQSDATAFHLGVFASKPWLSGAMYFALADFAARPGWGGGDPWPQPPFVQKGLVDLTGAQKPAFAVVARIYHATRQLGQSRRRGK